MNARNIGIVYRKELLDLLRDRRTIISMIVVPVVVMPLLMLGMLLAMKKVVSKAREEIPRVMVLGGADSPRTLAALRALNTIQLVPPASDYTNLISEKKIRAAVEIPKGFDASLQSGEVTTVHIYIYQGEIKSAFAAEPIERYFRQLREATVSERLAARQFPPRLLRPFEVKQTNVAELKKVSGTTIGSVIPYIIILMCMTGAIYPAVDLTAGEKERGTMETLLCSPVARLHLVLGKCLMILTAAQATTLLSLSSMGFSFMMAKKLTAGMAKGGAPLPLSIDVTSLLAVFVMMLPMAVFFSATMLTIALFSRSSKEAHSYLQPLLIVTILPAVASMLPGVELNGRLALIPVLNVSLVSKEILSGTYHWDYIILIFGSSCVYAGLALAAAVKLFNREEVMFRT